MKGGLVLILVLVLVSCENIEQDDSLQDESLQDGFSFIAYGDSRTNHNQHRHMAKLIEARNPDFVVHTGDMVEHGCQMEQYDTHLGITEALCRTKDRTKRCDKATDFLDTTFYPAPGNHEYLEDCPENYFKAFPFLNDQKFYSFDFKNIYFIILSTSSDMGIQEKWLKEELIKAQDYDYIFTAFHIPGYSAGGQELHSVVELWAPLFEEYGVDIAFNGHHHIYARLEVNGVTYIITGGGGAELYSIEETEFTEYVESTYNYVLVNIHDDKLILKAYNGNDELIDMSEITYS